ncbi:MAG: metal ABC transporter substrate-binding protein [Actinomycetota bacterium]
MLLLLGACDRAGGSGDRALEVSASFYPLAEIARRVGAEAVVVSDLTPSGAEPHDLELTAGDLRRLRQADLVLYLGGGFQPAVEDAIESLKRSHEAIDLLVGFELREPVTTGVPEGAKLGEQEHAGAADPHVWLDPVLMKGLVERVEAALARVAPARAGDLKRRAADYSAELDRLDAAYRSILSACSRREMFVAHAAFGYLADRYELDMAPIAGLAPEAEPTPRRLREAADAAKARGATTIFFETLVSPRVAEAVAREVGARVAVLNPIEGLTEEQDRAGKDYLSLMRDNLQSLAAGLGCTASR